jgi:hypothetical protein
LTAVHLAQSVPAFVEDTVKLPIASGTYITRVSFRLGALDYRPSRLRLQFHSAASNHVWSLNLPVPNAGYEVVVDQALNFDDGWSMGAAGTKAMFEADRWSIDWIGIQIRRNADVASQHYALDDFLLQGLFYITDNDGDRIADLWEAEHGLNSNDVSDASADIDHDGVSNYAEYRAGTDPVNWNSRFSAKISNSGGSSFELHWPSTANRTYSIWRASSLNAGFTKLAGGIHATPPENSYADTPGTNTSFYKIEVDPEL